MASARGEIGIGIWGDGKQARSSLFVDECIGSEEMVTINRQAGREIAEQVADVERQEGSTSVRAGR